MTTPQAIVKIFEVATLAAGRAIMDVLKDGAIARFKSDHSPVTEADVRAERIILDHLTKTLADIPVIAEESVAAGRIPDISGGTFILVDPLDGTREFITGKKDFTVNIALISDRMPVAGVVYAPALGFAYSGSGTVAEKLTIDDNFAIASREKISTRHCPGDPVTVASRSHRSVETDAFMHQHRLEGCTSVGSSLKFGLLAEGVADVYPRFSRTMQWDTAAGDAVLRAAGGVTIGPDGKPLAYGMTSQEDGDPFVNPSFIAVGRQDRHRDLLESPLFRR